MVQDFFLLVGADVGVDLRGSDGAVSKDMLNVAEDVYKRQAMACKYKRFYKL